MLVRHVVPPRYPCVIAAASAAAAAAAAVVVVVVLVVTGAVRSSKNGGRGMRAPARRRPGLCEASRPVRAAMRRQERLRVLPSAAAATVAVEVAVVVAVAVHRSRRMVVPLLLL